MRILPALLLLCLVTSAFAAELITVDPNTPEAKREMVFNQNVDQRLAQKVTCTLGYTRLHTAAEELSRTSGVAIKCGRNSDDWQVRDIPIVIYAKDLTLAKTLEGLALATHTQLSISHIDDFVSYRFLRASTLEKQIAQYEPDRQQALVDGLKWDWDAVVTFNKMPESDFPKGSDYTSVRHAYAYTPYAVAFARSLGAVLNSLGPSIRDKVASGQEFTVSTQTQPALAGALRSAAKRNIDYIENSFARNNTPYDRSTEPDVDSNPISLVIRQQKLADMPFLEMTIEIGSEKNKSSFVENLNSLVGRVTRYARVADSAPRPRVPEPPDIKAPEPMFAVPKQADATEPELITTKITLSKPAGEGKATAADAVVDLAKTAGVSIISEDFLTHLDYYYTYYNAQIYGKEQSISDSLRKINPLASYGNDPPLGDRNWIVDTENNLVLGRDKEWVRRHNNLIPENLTTWFAERLNGSGVMLESLVPMLDLSDEQKTEWIASDKDLKALGSAVEVMGSKRYSALWKTYASLNDDQRTLLSSQAGLPVGMFDPASMLRAVNNIAADDTWFSEQLCGGAKQLTEPEELENFSLKLTRQVSDGATQVMLIGESIATSTILQMPEGEPNPAFLARDSRVMKPLATRLGLHRWNLELRYDRADIHHAWSALTPDFPIYSNKRLAELREEAEAKQ